MWHWPVLVIAQMLADGLTLPGRIALAAASLLLAAQSYRLVENPIRRSLRLRASTGKSLALGGLLTIGVLVLVGSFRITATATVR